MPRSASIPDISPQPATPRNRGRSLPMALAEGAALLGGVALLEHFHLADIGGLPVHPFLFAIALLSAQYGALGGIAAAAAATILSFSDGVPVRPVGQDYFDFVLGAWSPALSWLAVAVLVGLVADRHFHRLDRTHALLAAAERERELIAGQYEILAARTRRLERRHAGFAEPASRAGRAQHNGRANPDSGASASEKRAIN